MLEQIIEKTYTEAEKHDIFQSEFIPSLRALYNFGFRLTLDPDDARDLVQDTYLKAFRFIDSFRKGTNAKAWLFRIMKNSFINEYRKKRKEPIKVDYQDVENTFNADESVGVMNAELRVEALQEELGDEISNALDTLDEDFKTVILLCDVEGFKYEEIAEILDIPIGTVRSRLHRARQMLKEKLVRYAREMGIKSAEI